VSPRRSVRFLVTGRVQGVGYRAAAAQEASRLGISGWAKNLSDGRVEVVARGTPDAVESLTEWLWKGPPAARVSSVLAEHSDAEPPPEFLVL
jgi:acylphosphatase